MVKNILKILLFSFSIFLFSCGEGDQEKEVIKKTNPSILDYLPEENKKKIEKMREEREENDEFF